MSLRRTTAASAAAILVTVALGGCTAGGDHPTSAASTARSPSATATSAPPPPEPRAGRCFRLGYRDALAATSDVAPVPCRGRHTATTFYVGHLDLVADGHLLSPDSARARAQVATECPARLGRFLGADAPELRLTSLRAVWFVPTVEQSAEGAGWFRCDVVALAGPRRLASLPSGTAEGLLSTPAQRSSLGLCGTAEPGSASFRRVICSAPHSWRALTSYDVEGRRYPGVPALRKAAQDTCQTAAQQVAADSLSYQWGYDWPTADQWRQGQHFGLCWAPEPVSG